MKKTLAIVAAVAMAMASAASAGTIGSGDFVLHTHVDANTAGTATVAVAVGGAQAAVIAAAVTNGGATINGEPITNGAAIVIAASEGDGTPVRVEAGSNTTVAASTDGGTNVFTVNASAGGSDYVLPEALTSTSVTIIYDNTNVLVLTHANPGSGPDMSGVYVFNAESGPPPEYQGAACVAYVDGSHCTIEESLGTGNYWDKAGSTITGTYQVSGGSPTAEGTITASYAKLTNTVLSGIGGLYLGNMPLADILAGAERGALAVTNNQTGVTLNGGWLLLSTNVINGTNSVSVPVGTNVYHWRLP